MSDVCLRARPGGEPQWKHAGKSHCRGDAFRAQSPVVILGRATAGILKGRGSLQDIDQISLVRSQVKWSATARRVRAIPLLLGAAFERAQRDVPGPVFLELPVDLLYDEKTVREWFERSGKGSRLEQQSYIDATINATSTRIKAQHILDLRSGVP